MDKELKSANGVRGLNAAHMVTGVKVEKFMGLGPSVMSQGEQQNNRSRKKESSGLNGRTSIVLCAIHKLKAEQFDTFGIYDGKDQNIGEFKAARCYYVPSEWRNPSQGWARRRDRGDMYGAKYIGRFKALLYSWYKEGSSNSE
mmetsp:Transcript_1135/g.2118  ORF Transcript_1135/g.2118 Transcript_1135/m.2118 type:complete len:143 (-) Transcript_1135:406-834(-)